jgi:hypothetical protein
VATLLLALLQRYVCASQRPVGALISGVRTLQQVCPLPQEQHLSPRCQLRATLLLLLLQHLLLQTSLDQHVTLGALPSKKGRRLNSRADSPYSNMARLFDFMAFVGILSVILALAYLGVGAASIASIAALVGVCGRIWVAISRPSGAFRADKAHVAWAPGKWQGKLETERRTDGGAQG